MSSHRHWSRGAVIVATVGSISFAYAYGKSSDGDNRSWQADAIGHAQAMRHFPDADRAGQDTPALIPAFKTYPNSTGMLGTSQPHGVTITGKNAFFQNIGSNQRTCFTCHQPQSGWTVSAADVQARFNASQGADPIFRLVDGATCPSADVSTAAAKRRAYSLLLNKGLFRIGLGVPSEAEFRITAVNDPYACNTDPATGLTSPTSGIVSVYRRPLPSANLGFLSAIMWDGREPSLASQASDATLGHAQSDHAPTADQIQQIVDFESGVFTAQTF
ncbi:MAG: cytochrome c peroxidase, partial [Burkholderiales bacterium]